MSRSVIICVCPMPNDYVERRAALTRAEKVATYRRVRSNAGLGHRLEARRLQTTLGAPKRIN